MCVCVCVCVCRMCVNFFESKRQKGHALFRDQFVVTVFIVDLDDLLIASELTPILNHAGTRAATPSSVGACAWDRIARSRASTPFP